MNQTYFNNVIQLGKLYLEHVFYEFESEPILFSCVDEEKNIYLCLCCEIRYKQRWVITECEISVLKALIEEKIDVATAFLMTSDVIVIDMDLQGNETSHLVKRDDIDELDLPEKGTYIRCNKEKAMDYLWNKEYEFLCNHLKATIEKNFCLNEISFSYKAVFNKIFNALDKQLEMYTVSLNKELNESWEKMQKVLTQTVMIKQEYFLSTNNECIEITDSIEFEDDYLGAA